MAGQDDARERARSAEIVPGQFEFINNMAKELLAFARFIVRIPKRIGQ